MRQFLCWGALVATGAVVGSAAVRGEEPRPDAIRTTNPVLQASLDRIAHGSALWRAAVDAVRPTGRHALVLTPDAVVVVDPARGDAREAFDSTVLAEISVVPGTGTSVQAILVVVNLPLIEDAHVRLGLSPAERDADLDRILIHEVYGHALPYLMAGDRSGRCADPVPGQRATDACSIQRENAVRAELDLGRRRDYGLDSLALARARQAEAWPPLPALNDISLAQRH